MSSIFPTLIAETNPSITLVFEVALAHFLFVLAITLPFDIRDIYEDANAELPTIPQLIGVSSTRIIAIASLLIFFLLTQEKIVPALLIPYTLLVALLILGAKPSRKPYYFLLFMDGSIILYYIVVEISFSQIFSI